MGNCSDLSELSAGKKVSFVHTSNCLDKAVLWRPLFDLGCVSLIKDSAFSATSQQHQWSAGMQLVVEKE